MRRSGLAAALAAALLAAATPAAALDLAGTWYVLVHYQDAGSSKPEAWRWDDRVWRLQRAGDALEWTEYSIVVFEDEAGRFEGLGGNRAARVVAAWEPSPAQLADIRDGLAVNSARGVKTKTLRPGEGGTLASGASALAAGGASVISYTEDWTIEDPGGLPVFVREDSLGGASAEAMEGRTEYRAEQVAPDGSEITGRFERDGTRVGRFRMIRSGEASAVGSSDQSERQRKVLLDRAVQQGVVSQEEVAAAFAAQVQLGEGAGAPVDRAQARQTIRENVESAIRAQGEDPRVLAPQVESLTRKIERALLDDGKSVAEVQRMLETGQLQP
ncbi:MAG: hypothetical protein OZ948_10510 [Deltaproteobacteria bacterium]|nr:hypothetical protein [Deltaproteobacteria bacterium]